MDMSSLSSLWPQLQKYIGGGQPNGQMGVGLAQSPQIGGEDLELKSLGGDPTSGAAAAPSAGGGMGGAAMGAAGGLMSMAGDMGKSDAAHRQAGMNSQPMQAAPVQMQSMPGGVGGQGGLVGQALMGRGRMQPYNGPRMMM